MLQISIFRIYLYWFVLRITKLSASATRLSLFFKSFRLIFILFHNHLKRFGYLRKNFFFFSYLWYFALYSIIIRNLIISFLLGGRRLLFFVLWVVFFRFIYLVSQSFLLYSWRLGCREWLLDQFRTSHRRWNGSVHHRHKTWFLLVGHNSFIFIEISRVLCARVAQFLVLLIQIKVGQKVLQSYLTLIKFAKELLGMRSGLGRTSCKHMSLNILPIFAIILQCF